MKNNFATIFMLSLLIASLTACTSNQKRDVGIAAGAVVGGVAGNAITGGSAAGTIVGAAAGGVVGNELAK